MAICKIIEDVLVDTGSMIDDNKTTHIINPGAANNALSQHMLNVKIYGEEAIF